MLTLKAADAKSFFFDRAPVVAAVDRGTRQVLSRFGAFVRTRSRSSIRKRKKISAAGAAPNSHTGLLKQFIFFAFDPDRKSVVIGPALLNGSKGQAPALLEYGGDADLPATRRHAARRARYSARPYMQPAFDRENSNLPPLWQNSVR